MNKMLSVTIAGATAALLAACSTQQGTLPLRQTPQPKTHVMDQQRDPTNGRPNGAGQSVDSVTGIWLGEQR